MSLIPKPDQTKYRGITFDSTSSEPISPSDGDTWIDDENLVRVYSDTDSKWYMWNMDLVPYGYIIGGKQTDHTNDPISSIDRLLFPFDSGTSKLLGNLSQTQCAMSACNSSSSAYIFGGGVLLASTPQLNSSIERFIFPFDSGTATHTGNLTGSKGLTSAFNSSTHGYICGGINDVSDMSLVERILFPFEGSASIVGNVESSVNYSGSCNNSTNAYILCGYRSNDRIQGLTFPFDSGSMTHIGNVYSKRCYSSGCNSTDYGYVMGGYSETATLMTSIERIDFPWSGGVASLVGNLAISSRYSSGFNSTDYGYCCSGPDECITSVQRITFPFDSGTASYIGTITTPRFQGCGIDGTDFKSQFI